VVFTKNEKKNLSGIKYFWVVVALYLLVELVSSFFLETDFNTTLRVGFTIVLFNYVYEGKSWAKQALFILIVIGTSMTLYALFSKAVSENIIVNVYYMQSAVNLVMLTLML